jgi:hypothetical protein
MMKKLLFLFALATVALITVSTNASACGDKFLVVGRGLRYERAYAAEHPGSILIYRNRNYDDPKAGSDLENALKKAGHKVQSVDDVTTLGAILKSTKFDLVVINLSDAPMLEEQIISSAFKPAVLPVIYNKTGTELAAAGKQYDCILKASGKNTDALKVVDSAMDEKMKGNPLKCKWSTSTAAK